MHSRCAGRRTTKPTQHSAFVRIHTDDGIDGIGEASPMQGGLASLGIIAHDLAPALIGKDPLDHAVLLDTLLHTLRQARAGGRADRRAGRARHRAVGPQGQAARPADLQAARRRLAHRAAVLCLDRRQRRPQPGRRAARRRDAAEGQAGGDQDPLRQRPRTRLDRDIPGDIAKARAVRKLVGDGFPLAFDANNGYSVGGAIRVGRALEELGYWWFEEPVQHYHVKAMGEVARALDITVSAGEQTYTLRRSPT